MSRWIILGLVLTTRRMLKGVGAIILLYCFKITKVNRFRKSLTVFFVCATLISVKSKYGSCSGSCTGLIKFNNLKYIRRCRIFKEGSVCRYDGLSCKLSSLLLSKVRVLFFLCPHSSTVEHNTVNIVIDVRFILGACIWL